MSKQPVNFMTFKDEKGFLCAVRVNHCSEEDAEQIAKQKLMCDKVKRTNEYKYMYHGFGKTIGMDEWENTWWLTESCNKISIPVYVFREVID